MNQHMHIPPEKGGFELAPEKLITIKEAANVLGLPTWKLCRAAQRGLIPTYAVLTSRRLVKLSEVIAVIDASRQGGAA
jgi:excisionase family DNA binding protein